MTEMRQQHNHHHRLDALSLFKSSLMFSAPPPTTGGTGVTGTTGSMGVTVSRSPHEHYLSCLKDFSPLPVMPLFTPAHPHQSQTGM